MRRPPIDSAVTRAASVLAARQQHSWYHIARSSRIIDACRQYVEGCTQTSSMMPDARPLTIGDRVRVNLNPPSWRTAGWFEGTVIRIDPYSAHRRFHWVELDVPVEFAGGGWTSIVAVLNPRHMVKI